MSSIAFLTTFSGTPLAQSHQRTNALSRQSKRSVYRSLPRRIRHTVRAHASSSQRPRQLARPHIAIIAKHQTETKQATTGTDDLNKGIFGLRANAYWDSIGVIPLVLAGFGVVALAIKMVKVKSGQLRGSTVNKISVPKTAITSEEQEAELHVFKCGGCGYEMYPARGREFKFFPDSFKCPLCGTPKSEFWDLNDPDDPRNQTDEDEDEDDDDDSTDPSEPGPVTPTPGSAVQVTAEDPAERIRADNSDTRSST